MARKIDTSTPGVLTLDDIRAQLRPRTYWQHGLAVVDLLDAEAALNPQFDRDLDTWLNGSGSTVWLRDTLMEPLRYTPEMVAISASIERDTAGSLTNWHNTWMCIDTAMARVRAGTDPEDF